MRRREAHLAHGRAALLRQPHRCEARVRHADALRVRQPHSVSRRPAAVVHVVAQHCRGDYAVLVWHLQPQQTADSSAGACTQCERTSKA